MCCWGYYALSKHSLNTCLLLIVDKYLNYAWIEHNTPSSTSISTIIDIIIVKIEMI